MFDTLSGIIEVQSKTTTDRIETLRQIIARQENRDVSYEEAQALGYKLLRFYEVLGEAE